MIEVKKRRACHCQHFTAVAVHHDTGCVVGAESFPVLVLKCSVKLIQGLLHDTLYIGVERKDEVIAVLGFDHRLFHIEAFVEISVLSSDDAVERIIIVFFQAACADISRTRESQNVAREVRMRVKALVAALEPDSLDIVIDPLGRGDLIFLLFGDPGRHFFQVRFAVLVGEILQRDIILR